MGEDSIGSVRVIGKLGEKKHPADGMQAAAEICGTLAETTYDDTDAFEAATGCEAAIMSVVREGRRALGESA